MAKNKIAITSKTPGRTQLANFYQFDKFRLIDLPGYGFSNNSKDKNSDIANIIDTYLSQRVNLFGVFQICDAGVITEMDKKMSIYFNKKFINHFIVLNKIDKISKSQLNNNLDRISKFLMVKKDNILSISAKNNIGINLIFKKITEVSKDI
jgi:GTP-binding protein